MRKLLRQQLDHALKAIGIRRPTRGAKANGDPCARYEVLLSAYTDGALDERNTALVEGHLNACASCRASLVATRLITGIVAEKPTPTFTADMSARLCMALAAERDRLPRRAPFLTTPRAAALGMACAALFAIVVAAHHSASVAPKSNGTSVATLPNARTTPSTSTLVMPNNSKPTVPATPNREIAMAPSTRLDAPTFEYSTPAIVHPRLPGGLASFGAKFQQPKASNHPVLYSPTGNSSHSLHLKAPDYNQSPQSLPSMPTSSPSVAPETPSGGNIASVPSSPSASQNASEPAAPVQVAIVPQTAPAVYSPPQPAPRVRLASLPSVANQATYASTKLMGFGGDRSGGGMGTLSIVSSSVH